MSQLNCVICDKPHPKLIFYQRGNREKSKIKESKQMNKLSALNKNKNDTYNYAIFHILKYLKINTLKKKENRLYQYITSI